MCDDLACFGFDEIHLLSYVLWHFVKWIVLNLDEFEVSVDKHQELDWVIHDYTLSCALLYMATKIGFTM